MAKKSSVDWLIKEFNEILGPIKTQPMQTLLLIDAFNKAKEMHKEEIKDAWDMGEYMGMYFPQYEQDTEEYYKETFGGNNE